MIFLRVLTIAIAFLCAHSAQAAYVIVGTNNNTAEKSLSIELKQQLFAELTKTPYPDINAIKNKYLKLYPNIQIMFVPDFIYQVIESNFLKFNKSAFEKYPFETRNPDELYGKDSGLLNMYKFDSYEKYCDTNYRQRFLYPYIIGNYLKEILDGKTGSNYRHLNRFYEIKYPTKQIVDEGVNKDQDPVRDFWKLNRLMEIFYLKGNLTENYIANVVNSDSLIDNHPVIKRFPNSIKDRASFVNRIIAAENSANQIRQSMIWRFTYGIEGHQNWLDSIINLKNLDLKDPELFKGGMNGGLSFAAGLMSAALNHFDVEAHKHPPKNGVMPNGAGSSCTLQFLETHLLALNNNLNDKNKMKSHALYALRVPHRELESLGRFFWDSRGFVPFYMQLRAKGETFHPLLSTHPKNSRFTSSFQPHIEYCIYDQHYTPIHKINAEALNYFKFEMKQYIPTIEDKMHLIGHYHKWMANNLEVFYYDNRFIQKNEQTSVHTHYKNFFNNEVQQMLRNMMTKRTSNVSRIYLHQKNCDKVAFNNVGRIDIDNSIYKELKPVDRIDNLITINPRSLRTPRNTENDVFSQCLDRSRLLATGQDPTSGKNYEINYSRTISTLKEKRTYFASLIADVFYYTNDGFNALNLKDKTFDYLSVIPKNLSTQQEKALLRHHDSIKQVMENAYRILYDTNKPMTWQGKKNVEAFVNNLYEEKDKLNCDFKKYVHATASYLRGVRKQDEWVGVDCE